MNFTPFTMIMQLWEFFWSTKLKFTNSVYRFFLGRLKWMNDKVRNVEHLNKRLFHGLSCVWFLQLFGASFDMDQLNSMRNMQLTCYDHLFPYGNRLFLSIIRPFLSRFDSHFYVFSSCLLSLNHSFSFSSCVFLSSLLTFLFCLLCFYTFSAFSFQFLYSCLCFLFYRVSYQFQYYLFVFRFSSFEIIFSFILTKRDISIAIEKLMVNPLT